MKFKVKIMIIMIIMLSILITGKSIYSMGGWTVETGDISLDWRNLINVEAEICNTNISHSCKNTQSCNIVVGPCVNKAETNTKTMTKTETGKGGSKSPKEKAPIFEISSEDETPSAVLTTPHPNEESSSATEETPTQEAETTTGEDNKISGSLAIKGKYGPFEGKVKAKF